MTDIILTVKVTRWRQEPSNLRKLYRYTVNRWLACADGPSSDRYFAAIERCERLMRIHA